MNDLSVKLAQKIKQAGWPQPSLHGTSGFFVKGEDGFDGDWDSVNGVYLPTTDELINALPQMIDDEKTGDSGIRVLRHHASGWSVGYEPIEREEEDIQAGYYSTREAPNTIIELKEAFLKDVLAEMWLHLKSRGIV